MENMDEMSAAPLDLAVFRQVSQYLALAGADGKRRRQLAAMSGMTARVLATVEAVLRESYEEIMREPLIVRRKGKVVSVRFLRSYHYIYDAERKAFNTWVAVPNSRASKSGDGAHEEVLWDRMLAQGMWHRRVRWTVVRNAWLKLLGIAHVPRDCAWMWTSQAEFIHRYLKIAAGRFGLRARIIASVNRQAMRKQIKDALGLDEGLWRLARQASMRDSHGVTDKWLTFVLRRRRELEQIRRETPMLLAPAAVMLSRDDQMLGMHAVGELKRYLTRQGLPSQCYRILRLHGIRRFRKLIAYSRYGCELEAVRVGLLMCRGVNVASVTAPGMVMTVAELFARPASMSDLKDVIDRLPSRLLDLAREQFNSALSRDMFEQRRLEFVSIINWLGMLKDPSTTSGMQSWRRFAQCAQLAMARHRAKLENAKFPFVFPVAERGGFVIEPIGDLLALHDEGVRMKHCVYHYQRDFRDGDKIAFHVTQVATGVCATIGFRKAGDAYRVFDVRGKCNRPMSRAWHVLAHSMLKEINTMGVPQPSEVRAQEAA